MFKCSLRLKQIFFTFLLTVISLALAFLILEFGLRLALYGSLEWRQSSRLPLIRKPHPTLGWLLAPDQNAIEESLEFQHIVTTNSKGLRDREYPYEKPTGVYRILVFGDSYMEAAHVAEEQGFSAVLETLLLDRRAEVVNMGVGGYATVSEWRYLVEEGIRYAPDLVLLAFYAENDVYGNSLELSKQFWGEDNVRFFGQPYVVWQPETGQLEVVPPDYARSLAGYEERLAAFSPSLYRLQAFQKSLTSHIYQQMRLRFIKRVRTPGEDANIHFGCYIEDFSSVLPEDTNLTRQQYQKLWEDAWQTTERVLLRMSRDAQENGARFAFFNSPARIQFESAYEKAVREKFPQLGLNINLPEEKLGAFAAAHDLSFCNLLPAFREADASGAVVNYNHDAHWNPQGHRLAAETVAKWLEKERLIPEAQ